MKPMAALCALSTALALSGCATPAEMPAAIAPPLSVGNGLGSQHGTYAAQSDGEMRGPSGERCIIYNWDRPLTKDTALRLRSASCASAERPGQFVAVEISRSVIPMSESNLRDEPVQ